MLSQLEVFVNSRSEIASFALWTREPSAASFTALDMHILHTRKRTRTAYLRADHLQSEHRTKAPSQNWQNARQNMDPFLVVASRVFSRCKATLLTHQFDNRGLK